MDALKKHLQKDWKALTEKANIIPVLMTPMSLIKSWKEFGSLSGQSVWQENSV